MIKYTCVHKESLRVHTFLSAYDTTKNCFKLVDLEKGILFSIDFPDEDTIERFLNVKYNVKVKQ